MYDVTIIGCGVIGASIAYRLSMYNLKVLVLEKENDVAMGSTKANSAIVHAGYDPKCGTLMARLNIRGSEMMEEVCQKLSVRYKKIGSLVLAFNNEELKTVHMLYDRGVKNGVKDMKVLNGDEAREIEPSLSPEVTGALFAPSAAIVDPWGLCLAEAETAVKNGVKLKLESEVIGIDKKKESLLIHTSSGDYETSFAINCAGVSGEAVSALLGDAEWKTEPSRGEYYLLDKSSGSLVHHVIFQCPTDKGKGVLLSPTVHGNLIVGPDSEPAEGADDKKTTEAGLAFVAKKCKISVPSTDLRDSIRNFSGVRANTDQPDFIIRPSKYSSRLFHAAGIKSPGLSASLAIAEYVVEGLEKAGLHFVKKDHFDGTRNVIRFKDLSEEEQKKLVAKEPLYGHIICRCETITEGEIVSAIHSLIPPCSVDGVKRRAGSGMGRCQGGFCGPRVLEILSRELKLNPVDIPKDGKGSYILTGETKGGLKDEV